MDKKTIVITILSVVIIGLIVFIISGRSGESEILFSEIQAERDRVVATNGIIKRQLASSVSRVRELEAQLISTNKRLKNIFDSLADGNEQSINLLGEYGNINTDFAEFIRQNSPTE